MHQTIQLRNSIQSAKDSINRAIDWRGFVRNTYLLHAATALTVFLIADFSYGYSGCRTTSGGSAGRSIDAGKDASCGGKKGCEGANTVKVFTGNVNRSGIIDLEIWGAAGQIPMRWERIANSRDVNSQAIFGEAHNWRHSWEWEMYDEGLNEAGQAQLSVDFPDGEDITFTDSSPGVWESPASIDKHLFQDGSNFYVQYPNGQRCRFEKLTNTDGSTYYQLQDIRDAEQNLFVLTYESAGQHRLLRVTEPAGRFFRITYGTVGTLSVMATVTTSDGRSVKYTYEMINGGAASFVALSGALYGDGAAASYSYTQSGTHPLLAHAIDPRYQDRPTNMQYTYADDSGFVSQELDGPTGQPMFTLTVDGDTFTATYGNGAVRVLDYPAQQDGQLNFEIDGLGRVTSYIYENNGKGFLIEKIDACGRPTKYTKSIYDNPLVITYPDGTKERWTRDDLDLPLTHTDEIGKVTTYTRDASHRVTRVDYPDGTFETFTYNNFSQVLDHQRKNGGVEHNVYDARGLKTSFQDAEGNVTRYKYDSAARLASTIDARGNTTRFQYTERGLLSRRINADGTFQTSVYDDFANRVQFIDELGHAWTKTYDEFRRIIDETDALGRVTHYDYDLPGGICGCQHAMDKPTKITLPSGLVKTMEYDLEWQKTAETVGSGSPDEATTHYGYDCVGYQTSRTDPRGKVWNTEYDLRERKSAFTDPLGDRTVWAYDKVGNNITITRPDGGITTNKFDSMHRLIQTTNPNGEVTKMAYDAEGDLVTLTDARKKKYQFTYDLLNRKLSMIYPDGTTEGWTWDPVSNLATYTTRAGQVRTYSYDNRNRETNSTWSDDTPAISRTYDAASRLLTMASSVSSLAYTYDDANELTSESQTVIDGGTPKIVQYTHTFDGLRDRLTYPSGTVVSYSYTGRNQTERLSDGGSTDPLVTYKYDLNGNRIGKILENGTSTVYLYDDANRMTNLTHQNESGIFASFEYPYDSVNRRTAVIHEDSTIDSFNYDAIDQVTNVTYGADGRAVFYTMDKVGNRTTVNDNGTITTYSVNLLNQYTDVGGASLTYDLNGNLATGNGWIYAYDAQNRLISASNGTTAATFAYDPLNRRAKQTIDGIDTFFYFDGWSLIDERDASDVQQAQYVNGAMLDEILSKTANGAAVYYHHDSIGNVTQLTDGTGTVVEGYSYDVFGFPTIKDASGNVIGASAFDNRFLFTGREFIQEVGLYDYRNRMYSSELGRFLQTDPLRFNADDKNIYRYVVNSPTNSIDPFGLGHVGDACSPIGATQATRTFTCPCCPPKGGTGTCTYQEECQVSTDSWLVRHLYYPGEWIITGILPPTNCGGGGGGD